MLDVQHQVPLAKLAIATRGPSAHTSTRTWIRMESAYEIRNLSAPACTVTYMGNEATALKKNCFCNIPRQGNSGEIYSIRAGKRSY